MKRRAFLRNAGCAGAAAAVPCSQLASLVGGSIQPVSASAPLKGLSSVEARYYKKINATDIVCELCPRHCTVTDGRRGYCEVRENRKGVYYTLVYGKACSLNIDPVEKKPLFHFYPGASALSLATAGCNVDCKFCQNWEISQARPEDLDAIDLGPKDIAGQCIARDVPIIAYTYTEPTVYYEYMFDSAVEGHTKGIKSVMISGGCIGPRPLAALLAHLDAVKIDLKSIRPEYYKSIVNGQLKPVLDTLVQVKKSGVWLEIVNLVVPTLNDSDAEFKEMAVWIRQNLGADVPLHFSRFHPQYQLRNLPATPTQTLERAYDIARANGLEYVYLGNVAGHKAESTYCPKCKALLVERHGYRIAKNSIAAGKCSSCSHPVPGRFSA